VSWVPIPVFPYTQSGVFVHPGRRPRSGRRSGSGARSTSSVDR
jgi:hypothetical protein